MCGAVTGPCVVNIVQSIVMVIIMREARTDQLTRKPREGRGPSPRATHRVCPLPAQQALVPSSGRGFLVTLDTAMTGLGHHQDPKPRGYDTRHKLGNVLADESLTKQIL